MITPLRNVILVLRFRGALTSLISDCGRMAYHHLKCDVFVIVDGTLNHCDRAVYSGAWDPARRVWVDNG